MPEPTNKPVKTRMRLLVAASRIFAEKGFQEATIAEICEKAASNIASVNYHFRDKETLYLEAWRYAFRKDLKSHPSDGGVGAEAPPEQRLAGRIRSLIARICDEESDFFAIINKEMAQPTRLLQEILEKEINPQRLQMLSLIKECLGDHATERHVQYCHASIIGQCFHLLRIRHLQKSDRVRVDLPGMEDTDSYGEHVVEFSLAGLRALKSRLEAGQGEIL
ncbi:MAG: CerR family C-terminal domain-containing protein [Gammaproteobacteria bacterium]